MEKRKKRVFDNERIIYIIIFIIFLILFVMLEKDIKKVNGVGRIINYSGLVRGSTQRLTKKIISDSASDEDLKTAIDDILNGLLNGSTDLQLKKLPSDDFHDRVLEVIYVWRELEGEFDKYRAGYRNQEDILRVSEKHFYVSNQLVSIAENYLAGIHAHLNRVESAIITMFIVMFLMIVKNVIDSARLIRISSELRSTAFIDKHTGVYNKSRCELVLNDGLSDAHKHVDNIVCMFDLNNLKTINDNYGHDIGDKIIYEFAKSLKEGLSEDSFLGRYGGDEFIAIIYGSKLEETESILAKIQYNIDNFNKNQDMPNISYSVGLANTLDFNDSLRDTMKKADENMYIRKRAMKAQNKVLI